MGPLHGVTILDATEGTVAGAFCTMLLGDLGAEVIKLESGEGDPLRRTDNMEGRTAPGYIAWNRNKKSVYLDLAAAEQEELFHTLVKDADAIVVNALPASERSGKCLYQTLKQYNPKLISTSVTPFGLTGEWKDHPGDDVTIQAMSGIMSRVAHAPGGETKIGVPVTEQLAGLYAAIGTIVALTAREKTGEGRQVDVSMLDSVIASMEALFSTYDVTRQIPRPIGNRNEATVPIGGFQTKDGKTIIINISTDANFAAFCEDLGAPELVEDDRFRYTFNRTENRDLVEGKIRELFAGFDAQELCEKFLASKVPHSLVYSIKDVFESEQTIERGMLARAVLPDGNTVQILNTPLHISGMERQEEYRIADVGADTVEVLSRYIPREQAQELYQNMKR